MHIAEVVTIAKSLPLLRLNTYKSLILSYSADYRRILQEKYVRSRKEVEQEDPMFDPVIGNDDFDVFWYNSLQVHPSETKGCFTVSYGCTKIRVALQCQDGKYKIADVELIP